MDQRRLSKAGDVQVKVAQGRRSRKAGTCGMAQGQVPVEGGSLGERA